MTIERTDAGGPLDAGVFSDWLERLTASLEGGDGIDVPCGDCSACCRSSQFVEIAPDEADTVGRIPPELLFPAPRRPVGHVVLGYDERGRCPMLGETGCTIYDHRPRTCRRYDCRVFAAAGVEPDDSQPLVAEQTRRWRFRYATPADERTRRAIRSAAAAATGSDRRPANRLALAILAVRSHGASVGD